MSWSLARRLASLMKQVEFRGECWIFTGPTRQGYGKYATGPAHRAAYELLVGDIPAGLELDHLCRNPACVFPDHLEPVTREENIRRRTELRTACKNGHAYTPENTHLRRREGRSIRVCRACSVEATRKYKQRKQVQP